VFTETSPVTPNVPPTDVLPVNVEAPVTGAAQTAITSVGTLTGLTVTNTIAGSIDGNAATATALATARTIGGVSFDGSTNITLPGVNAEGNQNTTGNAATATTTSRVSTAAAPASATSNGTQGEIRFDANYIYICISTNVWRRAQLGSW
jgi:hypothetical protein